ncbi:hypothetical protein [Croceivirga thetidis]|nr:hypothetical protein [Croceivirga thetidis]
MNTKKLLAGLMAIGFLAMTVVSTTVVDLDDQVKTEVKKKIVKM